MEERVMLRTGMDVYGADGDKIGSIIEVYDNYIMVEKGFFFPKDYYLPIDAIEGVDSDDRVYLTMVKDQVLNQGWDAVPDFTATTTTTAAGYTDVAAGGTDVTRVPIYEEDLSAAKRPVSRGVVRIEKELVTEDRTMTVPVTEERVRVTRVEAADATATASTADAFQEGVIKVPVSGEEIDVQKSARLAGEVVVEKEAVRKEKQVGGTVRREEVHVDDATVAGSSAQSSESAGKGA